LIKNPTPAVSAEALLSAASAASQAIGGASDTQSLLEGLAKSIPVLTLDNYVLSRFTKPDRSEVELIAVWNRSGPSTLKPGMRFAAWNPEHAAPDGAVIYEDFEKDPRSSEATRARMRANIDDRAELLHKVGCSIAFNSASEAIARVTEEEALWMTAELLVDSLRYPKIWIGEVDRRADVVRTLSAGYLFNLLLWQAWARPRARPSGR
jgi:hypothetical protein